MNTDNLESKIIKILRHETPLRAIEIARMLGVERREVNHYLYSSLKHLVIQNSDYRWSLKTNQISNKQYRPVEPRTPQAQSSIPVRQDNPYKVIRKDLEQASSEEKVKILENAFRQDRFTELEDEQINALYSVLEQAKREVSIANHAYTQGKLNSRKNKPLVITVVSLGLALGTLLVLTQLKSNQIHQPTPTVPQSR